MAEQHQQRLRIFASLIWYEEVIKFVFTFTAKTSEILLTMGLITSTANFLTEGAVMGNNVYLSTAWAWVQALGIDSSLGVTFYSVFYNIKHRDWIKVCCYGLLTVLLAVVAGTITNVDTFSHAVHTSIATAITQVGLNVKLLTTLRAIAVVGFVLMSRLKEVSFKELYEPVPPRAPLPLQGQNTPERGRNERTTNLIRELIAESIAPVITALTQLQGTAIGEQQKALLAPGAQSTAVTSKQPSDASLLQIDKESETNEEEPRDDPPEERDAKLARAYQELLAEGKRISGRALAARVHIRRSACNHWLAVHYPEYANEDVE